MRWKEPQQPKLYSERVVSKFLWLPLELKGETRWLETAKVRQVYLGIDHDGWISVDWAD